MGQRRPFVLMKPYPVVFHVSYHPMPVYFRLYPAPDFGLIAGHLPQGGDSFRGIEMPRVCQVTGKRPQSGNNVSHAKNRTRRRFLPNLHTHRFWVAAEKRWVKLRVSSKGMRIIDKLGIDQVIEDMRGRGEKV